MRGLPTLERICLEVLASSEDPYFQMQRRRMQILPEGIANALLQLLLHFQRLRTASQLDAFRDSATALHITPHAGIHLDSEWLAHIGSLRHLHTLSIRDVPRLKDKAMAPLAAAGARGTLRQLDLSGCSGLTSRSLAVLGQLTSLHTLALTGTGMRPPLLGHLTALRCLTRLHLGGCDISNSDITQHIAAFTALQDLDLWGCTADDPSAHYLTTGILPNLSKLSMAWSQVASALPLLPGLTYLDLSHCKLGGSFSDGEFAAAAEMQQLRVVLLVQTEVDAMGCELLETLLRASAANLQVLDLTMASLASQLPLLLALETAQQLSALSLASTQLADDFLPALSACSSLQILNLSLNPAITAAGLNATLPGFARQLQRLDLRGTGVGNTVLPVLKHLPQLQQLVLADTAITWESKAAAAAEGLDGAVIGNARVPAGGRAGDAAGLPAWQAASAAGAPIVQCRGPGKPAAGWASLRMLDVTNAKLTEAGIVELVGELVEAAAGGASRSSECGLQALHVGGMAGKLGRKALTHLSRLTSLQQLTLQDWVLTDRDLRHLHSLGQLQQLHIKGADPWLLSDDALLQLADELPLLSTLSRDGCSLLQAGIAVAAAEAPAGSASFSTSPHTPGQLSGVGTYTTSSSSAAPVSSSRDSIWPAGPLPQDCQFLQEPLVASPWLQRRSTPRAGVQHSAGGGRQGSASKAGSSCGGTVYQRLSAYDERFRYSTEDLLALRGQTPDAAAAVETRLNNPTTVAIGQALPAEIRAGATW